MEMREGLSQKLIAIKDCKEYVLSGSEWTASADYGLFHFTPSRRLENRELFADSTFADLFIDHKTSWGAPIPRTFQAFFQDIIDALLPPDHKLVLNVVDLYDGYFQQDELVERLIEPGHLFHTFIEKEIGERRQLTLLFECPPEFLKTVSDQFFSSSLIDVDAFVMRNPTAEHFQRSIQQGITDVMFREFIRDVYVAIAVWGDHNGLFLVTDKLDISALERLFESSALETKIKEYVDQQV